MAEMNRQELVKAVMEKVEQTPTETENVSDEAVNTEAEVETKETKPDDSGEKEKQQEIERKTGLQKRLDKLHREKMEAIERANELQRKLDEKESRKVESDDSERPALDEESRELFRTEVLNILNEFEQKSSQQKAKLEQDKLLEQFNDKIIKSFYNEYDEDSGSYTEAAQESIKAIYDVFSKDPQMWLKAIDKYGIEAVLRIIKQEDLPVAVSKQKDTVDKILEKERLMKTPKADSSNVTEKIERRPGENQKQLLKRIISNAMDRIK